MRGSNSPPIVDGEVIERLLDLVGECAADGTMRYEHGDDGKIYFRLLEAGALFEIVPGGLIRKHTHPDHASGAGLHRGPLNVG